MSEIKALDNLRNWAKKYGPMGSHDPLMFADEIEREVSERFMLLPVDMDNEPIHVGDELEGNYTVDYVSTHWVLAAGRGCRNASSCRHIKPDPLKELLTEMLDRNSDGVGYREFGGDFESFVKSYADRIRELMKEGDE